ncbi:hypothetical protein Vretifemale_12833, partial [Volvox reticuliferus]
MINVDQGNSFPSRSSGARGSRTCPHCLRRCCRDKSRASSSKRISLYRAVHRARVNLDDLCATCKTWQAELNLAIQPPRAQQCRIERVRPAFSERAIWKNSRTMRASSPTYFWTNSLPMTRIKQASVPFATARANRVLLVPGGPYMSTPWGGWIPSCTNFSGCSMGSSTTSRIFSICSLEQPISLSQRG